MSNKENQRGMSKATAETEVWMLARMRQEATFTFRDLWSRYGLSSPEYRQADRLIQRERCAGRIVQTAKRGVWRVAEPAKH